MKQSFDILVQRVVVETATIRVRAATAGDAHLVAKGLTMVPTPAVRERLKDAHRTVYSWEPVFHWKDKRE